MRRAIIVTATLIGLVPLLIISVLHFLPSPKITATVSGKAVPTDLDLTPKFNTYENNIYGISIEYPSIWQKVELDGDNLIASFYSSTQNESGLLENVVLQVVGLPYYNKTTMRDIVAEEIATYKSQLPNFQFLSSVSNVTLSGIPINKIEYSHTKGQLQIKTMEIFTIRGKEAYKIIFNADTPEYASLLSTVEKMINSFEIKYPEHPSTFAHV